MPRTHPKTRKMLFIAGSVVATAAALGAGTALSASAATTVSATAPTYSAASGYAKSQCQLQGYQKTYVIGSQQNQDSSWNVTVECQ